MSRGRARHLATRAGELAAAAGVVLPADLGLWRPDGAPAPPGVAPEAGGARSPMAPSDAAWELVAAMEEALTSGERRRGAHYTPRPLARRLAELALSGSGPRPRVVDPACGGGALLLAVADQLAARGADRREVVRDLLWGCDLDPLAVAVTEAVLALWSGGQAPAPGQVTVADPLHDGPPWRDAAFDCVVGNPPFQGQLSRATARTRTETAALRARWGPAVSQYSDTAALFLLVGVELVRPGGRVAMLQPQSTAGARDAAGLRAELDRRARLVELWAPRERFFAASVTVCVPVLEARTGPAPGWGPDTGPGVSSDDLPDGWSGHLARARGVPTVDGLERPGGRPLGSVADVAAGFRDEYYGLVPHVRERIEGDDATRVAELITSGAIEIGHLAWGARPIRFAKARWREPVVDLAAVAAAGGRTGEWVGRMRRPKVLVASQTKVVEAAADPGGTTVPVTPVIGVVPHEPADVGPLVAALCSPPVAAWVARRSVGTALSVDALRLSAPLVARVPLPLDAEAWQAATDALGLGDWEAYGAAATAMYGLAPTEAAAVLAWWMPRALGSLGGRVDPVRDGGRRPGRPAGRPGAPGPPTSAPARR